MTTSEYINDPRFSAHGMAIKRTGEPAKWVPAEGIAQALEEYNVRNSACLCHHAHFDGAILGWHYGIQPRVWLDTLPMARALLGNHIRAGLENLATHFDLAPKSVPYKEFDGFHWHELSPAVQSRVAAGSCHDVELTWEIFTKHLGPYFPKSEFAIVDATVRMFTEPVLRANPALLEHVLDAEHERKAALLRAVGVNDPKDLRSPEAFAEKLREFEIEPATKPGKDGPIYAFAATDAFMDDLLNSDEDTIVALAEARLAVQSSITERRTERLLRMAQRGAMPVYLTYCGAATTRWSGGDKCNWQNLPPEVQACIELPGCVVDASQIEARLLHYMAGQWDMVERWRRGDDLYCNMASAFYKRPITKADEQERQVGKVVELMCGYGSGGAKIQHTLRVKAGINLSPGEALDARDAYRRTHPRVVNYWREADRVLSMLWTGAEGRWGPMTISEGCLWLPNGLPLIYDTLKYEDDAWQVRRRSGWQKLYGAKLVENCLIGSTQALTISGWRAIRAVQADDLLWDGEEWVAHAGVVCRGVQEFGFLDGVGITADHEVLTVDGWIRASQAQGLQRAAVRFPDRCEGRGIHREQTSMGSALRLWEHNNFVQQRATEEEVLRVPKLREPTETEDAWHVQTPRVCRMAVDVGSLSVAIASRVEKLRRSWHFGLQTLAEVRKLLARYGRVVSVGIDVGASRQCQRLYAFQLPLGYETTASAEYTLEPEVHNPLGSDYSRRGGAPFGGWSNNVVVSHWQRMAASKMVYSRRRAEPVFDVLNCGPRHRFVVKGSTEPFIVSNCIQALARVYIAEVMQRLNAAGLRVLLMRHDDLVIHVADDKHRKEAYEWITNEMRKPPAWAHDIPLNCGGHVGSRLKEMKNG